MKLARLASFIHKWLALILGIQIVFWIGSGLFFTIFPIEQIRSEYLVRSAEVEAPDLAALGALNTIRDEQGRAPVKLTIERRASGDVIVAEFPEAPPALFEAGTLQRLSPLDEATATRIARAHVTLTAAPQSTELVTSGSAEYRGALPAWPVKRNRAPREFVLDARRHVDGLAERRLRELPSELAGGWVRPEGYSGETLFIGGAGVEGEYLHGFQDALENAGIRNVRVPDSSRIGDLTDTDPLSGVLRLGMDVLSVTEINDLGFARSLLNDPAVRYRTLVG